ncbi:hypothetical protein E2C01_024818 [Portunus trituberculatus]|uniref:Uncharacterized protein n=1 Tax=Portunus trituberculatus TaxID=210409 RepID=A0A5B7EDU3_PORTR|nr:hypothetical protein [Portunus trituberculatus]
MEAKVMNVVAADVVQRLGEGHYKLLRKLTNTGVGDRKNEGDGRQAEFRRRSGQVQPPRRGQLTGLTSSMGRRLCERVRAM